MSNIPIPEIHPILDTVRRPFWSVMIPTYNRTSFLKKTIRSVLDQDPGSEQMQIEVIDNFSDDFNIPEFVKEVGNGRVSCYRQPKKVDFQENWTTCIRRSRGRWVHILHDDDIVQPSFYSEYQKFIEMHPEVDLVFSQAKIINENDEMVRTYKPSIPDFPEGVLSDAFRLLLLDNFIYSTSAVVSRKTYEKIGGFDPNLMHTVDWDTWLRISLNGTLGYVNQPLLAYRVHRGSGSNTQNNSTDLIDKKYEDISYIINNYEEYLPMNLRKSYHRRFMKTFAVSANHQTKILLQEKNYQPAFHHATWSKKMYPSFLNTCRYWWYNLRYFRRMH
jgi:glycosyltransferase involved in cell wall biosynthesis